MTQIIAMKNSKRQNNERNENKRRQNNQGEMEIKHMRQRGEEKENI